VKIRLCVYAYMSCTSKCINVVEGGASITNLVDMYDKLTV